MPRNSTGVYTLPLPAVISGELIESAWANDTLDDVAQALTDSLDREGRGGMVAPFTLADGTVINPGLAFSNAPGTGMYRTGTETGFSWNAALVFSYNANGITVVDPGQVFVAATPSTDNSLTNKAYVDDEIAANVANYLPLTGGTLSGNLTFSDLSEGLVFSSGSRIYDAATTWVIGNAGPTITTMGWYFDNALKMSLSVAGALTGLASISASGNIASGATVSGAAFSGGTVAGSTGTFSGAVSGASFATAGAVSAASWFNSTAASTGWVNSATGVGLYSTASDRLEQYGGTYFIGPTALFSGSVTAFYSDVRLKDVTMKIDGALARIARLDAFMYRHNDLARSYGYADNDEHMGLSAQQVKQEFPPAVALAPFDFGEGGVSKSGENYLTIRYENLVPPIIAALKEVNARLALLEHPTVSTPPLLPKRARR